MQLIPAWYMLVALAAVLVAFVLGTIAASTASRREYTYTQVEGGESDDGKPD